MLRYAPEHFFFFCRPVHSSLLFSITPQQWADLIIFPLDTSPARAWRRRSGVSVTFVFSPMRCDASASADSMSREHLPPLIVHIIRAIVSRPIVRASNYQNGRDGTAEREEMMA